MLRRKWKFRVEDILQAIGKSQRWTEGLNYEQFKNDEKTVAAVATQFTVIGEASRRIPDEAREKYPEVAWGKMIGMRNFIVHEYDRIDTKTVWDTIQEDFPPLVAPLQKILENEPEYYD